MSTTETDSPLLLALKGGCEDLARYWLLECGPSHEWLERQSEEGDGTPLFWAACANYQDVVELLLTFGARVDSRTSWGATALHAAADNNRKTITKTLIRWGANVNAQTVSGETPAHMAAFRGYDSVLSVLLSAGSNIRLVNCKGNTVAKEALAQGMPAAILVREAGTRRQSSAHKELENLGGLFSKLSHAKRAFQKEVYSAC